MEEELRWRRLEIDVHNHNRRLEDHEAQIIKNADNIAVNTGDIKVLQKILEENRKTNELIGEVVDYAKKTYEVFEPLAKLLSTLAKIGLIFTFLWHGVKYLAIKMGFLT